MLIPLDHAFKKWIPVDYGIYPFEVSDFTETMLRNHIIPTEEPITISQLRELKDEKKYKTLGGETVVLKGKRK